MMTETYENIGPDLGFRFVSEQVPHILVINNAHAEAKKFKYWQSTGIKVGFGVNRWSLWLRALFKWQ
jgi:hypothetical protein